jgi:hypothetical protein
MCSIICPNALFKEGIRLVLAFLDAFVVELANLPASNTFSTFLIVPESVSSNLVLALIDTLITEGILSDLFLLQS